MMRILNWISNTFGKNSLASKSLWEQDLAKKDPTKPINFGHKWSWAAVKTEDTDALLKILNLKKLKKANWVEGYIQGFKGDIFILPPIAGWTLMMGDGLPGPYHSTGIARSEKLLNQLSENFENAQLFGNFRGSGSAFWMKSISGRTKRLYAVGDGKTFIMGEPTAIECKWELFDSDSLEIENDEYWNQSIYPDVEHVLMVAEDWSINPHKIEYYENVGEFGYVGILT